ncbi:MAG: hypothetical protein E7423_07250 [Ruminococcaceae bacterium]|nr:hypothetical protein [Oscillospiraceae bacterium]
MTVLLTAGPGARACALLRRNDPVTAETIRVGRADLIHVHIAMPPGARKRRREKLYDRALARAAAMGARFLVAPPELTARAARHGLRRPDELSVLRGRAAEAVRSLDPVSVRVCARMASREVCACLLSLAETVRYVTACGGDWAAGMNARLLREYGTADPGPLPERAVAVVFDGGFARREGETVVDLTCGELEDPAALRPVLRERTDLGLPPGDYDRSLLLCALVRENVLRPGSVSAVLDSGSGFPI